MQRASVCTPRKRLLLRSFKYTALCGPRAMSTCSPWRARPAGALTTGQPFSAESEVRADSSRFCFRFRFQVDSTSAHGGLSRSLPLSPMPFRTQEEILRIQANAFAMCEQPRAFVDPDWDRALHFVNLVVRFFDYAIESVPELEGSLVLHYPRVAGSRVTVTPSLLGIASTAPLIGLVLS